MGLTVHHLQISQSERVPWLCEELGIDYTLKNYKRAPLLAPPEYRALHPAAAAPVINDGDLTIAESGACLEYIDNKYGGGKFTVKPDAPNYADYLFWWHWSNGTLQPLIGRYVAASKNPDPDNMMYKYVVDKYERCMKLLNDRLGKVDYLSGSEPTLPDFMIVYTLSTGRYFNSYSLESYPNIVAYLGRVGKREAYQRAMKKCEPDLALVLTADPPAKPLL